MGRHPDPAEGRNTKLQENNGLFLARISEPKSRLFEAEQAYKKAAEDAKEWEDLASKSRQEPKALKLTPKASEQQKIIDDLANEVTFYIDRNEANESRIQELEKFLHTDHAALSRMLPPNEKYKGLIPIVWLHEKQSDCAIPAVSVCLAARVKDFNITMMDEPALKSRRDLLEKKA